MKSDDDTFQSVAVKRTKTVEDVQKQAVGKQPKQRKLVNIPLKIPKANVTDVCIRSRLKRLRSYPNDNDITL